MSKLNDKIVDAAYVTKFRKILLRNGEFNQEVDFVIEKQEFDEQRLTEYWYVVNSYLKESKKESLETESLRMMFLCYKPILLTLQEEGVYLTIGSVSVDGENIFNTIPEEQYLTKKHESLSKDELIKEMLRKKMSLHAWLTTKDGTILDSTLINKISETNDLDFLVAPLDFLKENGIDYKPYDIIDYVDFHDLESFDLYDLWYKELGKMRDNYKVI